MLSFNDWYHITESEIDSFVYIATLKGSTSGYHGSHNVPERAAPDPIKFSTWEIHIKDDPSILKYLINRPGVIVDKSGGSYHERWVNVEVYVSISKEALIFFEDHYEELGVYTSKWDARRNTKLYNFKFHSISWMKKEVLNILKPKDTSKKTAENYWKDKVDVTKMGKPVRRNPLTGKPEGWDGD